MAASDPASASYVAHNDPQAKVNFTGIKKLAVDFNSNIIPTNYIFDSDTTLVGVEEPEETIPVVNFALLTSNDPRQRSTTIQQLGKACEEWGVFLVTNHGVPETLLEGMMNGCQEFYDLPEEEKHVVDGIVYGTGVNNSHYDQVTYWRDYIKVVLHPEFTPPHKPIGFSETMQELTQRFREITRELLKGMSTSLGLEENYINNVLNMENGYHLLIGNFYPPCPQPQLATGLPPHTDPNLLSILTQNEIGGLQVMHKGKWVNINVMPNSFIVLNADQIEILSNGIYKSVVHRAALNNRCNRISTVTGMGPALDAVVGPAPNLVHVENKVSVAYTSMKYKDYVTGIHNRTVSLDSMKITKPDCN